MRKGSCFDHRGLWVCVEVEDQLLNTGFGCGYYFEGNGRKKRSVDLDY
jgi:hypothetical protein